MGYFRIDLWGGVQLPTGGESPRLSKPCNGASKLNRCNSGADGKSGWEKIDFQGLILFSITETPPREECHGQRCVIHGAGDLSCAQLAGSCRVNPPVGAVLVRDGVVIGQGFHKGPGSPHAEAAALMDAGIVPRRNREIPGR